MTLLVQGVLPVVQAPPKPLLVLGISLNRCGKAKGVIQRRCRCYFNPTRKSTLCGSGLHQGRVGSGVEWQGDSCSLTASSSSNLLHQCLPAPQLRPIQIGIRTVSWEPLPGTREPTWCTHASSFKALQMRSRIAATNPLLPVPRPITVGISARYSSRTRPANADAIRRSACFW
jgi:hypothetical protein